MNKQHKIYTLIIIILLATIVLSACSGAAVVQAQNTAGQLPALSDQDPQPAEPVQNKPVPAQTDPQADTPVDHQEPTQDDENSEASTHPPGWSDETHSNSAEANYEVVFPQDEVNSIHITIAAEDWQAMQKDMTSLYGEQGTGGTRGMRPGGGAPPINGAPAGDDGAPPIGGGQPAGQQAPPAKQGGMKMGSDINPIWAEATIDFEGNTWTNVGIRFKGNSSLMSSWRSGNMKLPFKLDFDEFEDDYPEIDNQRFYGFKQLTLSSGFNDDSLLREKVAADLFREAGVAAPQTAFYAVYVDYGEGPVYFGLYTMVEVVDDTVIETQFEDDSGNVYKPEGAGATFAEGSFSPVSFDKETNQDEDDYSDILALYAALHSDLRSSDPQTWRAELEAVFDVETFLRWLAVNTVVQNWDTYGLMNHNYYLYNDPTSGQLTWIPWDNNEAMQNRQQRGMLSLSLDEVGAEWPLIRYLLDDPVYQEIYIQNVEDTINGVFEPAKMAETFQKYHDLIQPYVIGQNGEQSGYSFISSPQAFASSVASLIAHVQERYNQAQVYILSQ